jgi:demethylmenaquinone methyltransferase/2-methoxy-6-polyprenyl-1,4-benzoquinol methylase
MSNEPERSLSPARALFNQSAPHYDWVNRLFSLGSGSWYRRRCLRKAGLKPGMRVVDVAVGTGLLAREAVALTGDSRAVIGIDVSEAMLAIARKTLDIHLIQGTAEALPLGDKNADFVTMGYALRHIFGLEAAFAEAVRVLKPGGILLLLEISLPAGRLNRFLARAYIGAVLPALAWVMTGDKGAPALMRYHWETIASSIRPTEVMGMMAGAGLQGVTCVKHFDLFQYYTGRKAES